MLAKVKHSSLFARSVSGEEKKSFITLTPGRIKKQLESARGLIAQKLPVACITHTFVLQIPTHPHVLAVATKELFGGCHDTHNDDFWHNDTQHDGIIRDTQHKSTSLSTECRYAECRVFIVMLYVILSY